MRNLSLGAGLSLAVAVLVACDSSGPSAAPPAPPATAALPNASDVAPTPTTKDLEILRRADALLGDARAWNHFGDRTCDPAARSWNLYCVLERASFDVTGSFEHRSAALQEVRWVVDERTRGIELAHRLMDFNNMPSTTFTDVKSVIADATRRLEAKIAAARH
jgi:hypothetical protein